MSCHNPAVHIYNFLFFFRPLCYISLEKDWKTKIQKQFLGHFSQNVPSFFFFFYPSEKCMALCWPLKKREMIKFSSRCCKKAWHISNHNVYIIQYEIAWIDYVQPQILHSGTEATWPRWRTRARIWKYNRGSPRRIQFTWRAAINGNQEN